MNKIFDELYDYSTRKQLESPKETMLEIDKTEGQRLDGQHSQSFWYGYWQAVCDISSYYAELNKTER